MSPTIFKRASLFDGTSFVGERDVLVDGDRIARVGVSIDVHSADVIEANGLTLLPGLIDCHVHTWGEALTAALAFGVTTVVDMFTSVPFMQAMMGPDPGRADMCSCATKRDRSPSRSTT